MIHAYTKIFVKFRGLLRKPELYTVDSPEPLPKVSQHQPCPNHVGGKTFAEIGTQTFPKNKKQHHPSSNGGGPEAVSDSSLSTLGCAAGIRQR